MTSVGQSDVVTKSSLTTMTSGLTSASSGSTFQANFLLPSVSKANCREKILTSAHVDGGHGGQRPGRSLASERGQFEARDRSAGWCR